jgi:hypothetical protein
VDEAGAQLGPPESLWHDIREHVATAGRTAPSGYWSAAEEEDSLTGDFGATLRTGSNKLLDSKTGRVWFWRVTYRKIRGRGPDATERLVGADGILQILVAYERRVFVKGLLFQAKNAWSSDRLLRRQCSRLGPWGDAAVVFDYRPESYDVYTVQQVVLSRGIRSLAGAPRSMANFLADSFVACKEGALGLYYRPSNRELFWPSDPELVAAEFGVKHRIAIEVGPDDIPDDLEPLSSARVVSKRNLRQFPLTAESSGVYPAEAVYTWSTS